MTAFMSRSEPDGASAASPGSLAQQLYRDIGRVFDDSFRSFAGLGTLLPPAPRPDMRETQDEMRVEAEVPGMADSDLNVKLAGDILILSGEKRCERKDDREHLVERSFGAFRRSVRLPFAPEPKSVTASCKDGVLVVMTLPPEMFPV